MVKWDMSGDWVLAQSNGCTVSLHIRQHVGGKLEGSGQYTYAGSGGGPFTTPFGGTVNSQSIDGTVTDTGFTLEIDWEDGRGIYQARIDEGGNIRDGLTTDMARSYEASFGANRKVRPAPESPFRPRPAEGSEFGGIPIDPPPLEGTILMRATVTDDVDVYAEPGGVGAPIGVLRKGSNVVVPELRDDKWCHVKGDAVPTASRHGWVWGEFLSF